MDQTTHLANRPHPPPTPKHLQRPHPQTIENPVQTQSQVSNKHTYGFWSGRIKLSLGSCKRINYVQKAQIHKSN